MSALHALGEQGGWPLTMFIAPDGAPFWGGTYFPPEPRWGRPSFRQVLQGVVRGLSHRRRDGGAEHRRRCAACWRSMSQRQPGRSARRRCTSMRSPRRYLRLNDPEQGGLRGAPKFPNPPIFRFLWQNAFRTGAPEGQEALHLMLQRMSQGGIYDHLGGGYARYSTDAVWLVPHFEKMLYDNAQLLELLALAHAHRPDPLYAAARGGDRRLDGARHDRRSASTAAPPSPRRKTPTARARKAASTSGPRPRWTRCWVRDAPAFKRAYDVTPGGNWEGHTILRRVTPPGIAGGGGGAGAGARGAVRRRGRSASGPGATTRCWRTGTAWRSPPWRARPRCSVSRTGWRARARGA